MPLNIEVPAERGDNLLEVLHRAGVPIEAECGGQGLCESCVVMIVEGSCEKDGKNIGEGVVQSCQVEICDDITVKLPTSLLTASGKDYSSCFLPESDILFPGKLSPLSKKTAIELPAASLEENTSDFEWLAHKISPDRELFCSLSVLKTFPRMVHHNSGVVTATIVERNGGSRIVKLERGVRTARHFGLACDVGTTTVALKLVDLNSGLEVASASSYNDQIECGADVISRIIYSQKSGRLKDLQDRIIRTINRLLNIVLSDNGVSPDDVTCAVFSGNTTMTHLMLGINPKYIREEPYVPAVKFVPPLSAGELKIRIHPEAPIIFAPSVGSYVGGDITSGVLCLLQKPEEQGIRLFIDIGTNGELVIMGDKWMMGCACSAGPAFEGVGIKCGMRASEGAIEGVEIREDGSEVAYRVIGGGKPKGICGSGLIELTAVLFKNGIIGRDGRFTDTAPKERIHRKENSPAFVIAKADQTADGREIYLNEQDTANIMRAKAAIFSACSLLLKKVGLSFNDIKRVYVAGGFGCCLNFANAVTIGLFPDIGGDRFEYLGNTSLMGAHLALISGEHREHLMRIAKSMTYIDLSSEPDYMDEYTAALFLPHTDKNLFPTVKL